MKPLMSYSLATAVSGGENCTIGKECWKPGSFNAMTVPAYRSTFGLNLKLKSGTSPGYHTTESGSP